MCVCDSSHKTKHHPATHILGSTRAVVISASGVSFRPLSQVMNFPTPVSHHLPLYVTGDGGEIDSLNQVDVPRCVESVRSNRDFVVGIKLRLTASISNNGRNEQESYR